MRQPTTVDTGDTPAPDAPTSHGPIRVLVVDDNADHRLLMGRRLTDAGYAVHAAADPWVGLERLHDADLALVDYAMPGMDGLTFLDEANQRGIKASVVLVTAQPHAQLAVAALKAGAVDFVTKTAGYLDQLPHVVERAWRHHDHARRARELQRQALLVNGVSHRADVFDEIVSGTATLLAARSVTLLLDEGAALRVAASRGEGAAFAARLARAGSINLPARGEVVTRDDCLVAALLAEEDEPYGVLVVEEPRSGVFLAGDIELARAFAAFAGIALRNLRRRELEAALIDELQRTMQARRDFIASVSHELRTPLTAILGFAELLDRHRGELDEDAQHSFVGKIAAHAGELRDLVDQLMDLAVLERGRSLAPDLRTVDVSGLIRASVDAMAVLLEGRDLAVDGDDVGALADPDLVRRCVSNYVSNAAKFSPPGTPIRIRSRADGDAVRVEVVDIGVGLAPQQAARVFDAFWRAPSAVGDAVRGSGIGLALVREYVAVMGGQVGVESSPGRGSTFWFTLPRG